MNEVYFILKYNTKKSEGQITGKPSDFFFWPLIKTVQ